MKLYFSAHQRMLFPSSVKRCHTTHWVNTWHRRGGLEKGQRNCNLQKPQQHLREFGINNPNQDLGLPRRAFQAWGWSHTDVSTAESRPKTLLCAIRAQVCPSQIQRSSSQFPIEQTHSSIFIRKGDFGVWVASKA